MIKSGYFAFGALLALVCVAGPATPAGATDDACFYRGTMYSDGAASCQNKMQFKCDDGEWEATQVPCEQPANVAASRPCSWDGVTYSTGAASCQGGTQYRCEDGTWRSIARPCTVMGANTVKIDPAGDTCMYEGATVATGSTICKTDTTFLCNDGQWINLGTLCR